MRIDEDLILQYFNNTLSEADTQAVEEWYNTSNSNKDKLHELYSIYKLNRATIAYGETDTEKCFQDIAPHIQSAEGKKQNNTLLFKRYAVPAAAFVIGVFITLFSLFLYTNESDALYVAKTPRDQRSEIILPDGSKVWLNASTQLAYHHKLWSKKREVTLDGEAYFEVASNQDKPFVVSAQGVEVKVLGTKFNVRNRKEEHEVITTLLHGSVEVENKKTLQSVLLKPGESAVINREDDTLHSFKYTKPENILLWRSGQLTFENSSLQTITETLEQHYNVEFKYESEALQNEKFTCSFSTNDDIAFILNILTLTDKFEYRIDSDVIYLSVK